MKKRLSMVLLGLLMLTSACAEGGIEGNYGPYAKGTKQAQQFNPNDNDRFQSFNVDEIEQSAGQRYGFVRHSERSAAQSLQDEGTASYDKELMADSISKIAASLQDVEEAATLVTDEYVLIAYDTFSGEREEVADQVKKGALSFVPAHFNIVVADNPAFMPDIQRFASLSTPPEEHEETIEQTVKEMMTYPQGEPVDLDHDGEPDYDPLKKSENELNDREVENN
ncbi:YhcN/YlaJ family sporulation lipoprotein [Texcoconibacillus texcoconensis]|uniref:Sporulation protein n=1 Tax=Texcoconibacillus texcoconensis TaxID=1095777 RepID=A0A840QQF6_9BACI|nr:YhcN/YlaJ family sporulation lipoprotein [Texcoconibacillus texcoconensis]MBB5173537.1 hypothetical protein [Texcoconibacillus texcoconensis]